MLAWSKKTFDALEKEGNNTNYIFRVRRNSLTTSFVNSEYFEWSGNDILLEGLDYTSGCGLEGLDFNGGNKEVILIVDKIQIPLESWVSRTKWLRKQTVPDSLLQLEHWPCILARAILRRALGKNGGNC